MNVQLVGNETRKSELLALIPDLTIHLVSLENAGHTLTFVDLTYLKQFDIPLEQLNILLQNAIAIQDPDSHYSRDELLHFYQFLDCINPKKEEILDVVSFYSG